LADIKYTVNVRLWFNPADVPKLRALAAYANTRRFEDRELFQKAANTTEVSTGLIVQVMTMGKLAEVVAAFTDRGIQRPLIEDLNLASDPARDGLKLPAWT
jgi:hypothetical protein